MNTGSTAKEFQKVMQRTLSVEAFQQYRQTKEYFQQMFLYSETKEDRRYWLGKMNEDVSRRNLDAWNLALEIARDINKSEFEGAALESITYAYAEQMMLDACNIPPHWTSHNDCKTCGSLPCLPGKEKEACRWCDTELGRVAQAMREAADIKIEGETNQ